MEIIRRITVEDKKLSRKQRRTAKRALAICKEENRPPTPAIIQRAVAETYNCSTPESIRVVASRLLNMPSFQAELGFGSEEAQECLWAELWRNPSFDSSHYSLAASNRPPRPDHPIGSQKRADGVCSDLWTGVGASAVIFPSRQAHPRAQRQRGGTPNALYTAT
jgi:hypothetical protein